MVFLKHWRKVLQMMLLKKTGNYRTDKLCVIQLIKADLNMYFKLIWGNNTSDTHTTVTRSLANNSAHFLVQWQCQQHSSEFLVLT